MRKSATLTSLFPLVFLSLSACTVHKEEQVHESHKITATSPIRENVIVSQPFVCQIHSQRHIELRALERGYLEAIQVQEGQAVKAGDVLFTVIPAIYKAKLDAEIAEVRAAQMEFNFSQKLASEKVISPNEVAMLQTKLQRAQANLKLAEAEFDFASVKAPFDGIIHRLNYQQGSLIDKGDILTSLSDNNLMWVYFNVPEALYPKYRAILSEPRDDLKIELVLANGQKFNQLGKLGAIEADFDNTSGNIQFRADFPNPDRLLRNGQTGTVWIRRVEKDALVIPQRATFEYVDKLSVYVLDKDDVAHRRDIVVKDELEDVYVLESGLSEEDKIIFEGIRQVRDDMKVEYAFRSPEDIFKKLKFHAE